MQPLSGGDDERELDAWSQFGSSRPPTPPALRRRRRRDEPILTARATILIFLLTVLLFVWVSYPADMKQERREIENMMNQTR